MGDPRYRLATAAHEAGHYVVWRAGGVEIHQVYIREQATGTTGYTETELYRLESPEQARSCLLGLLAGRAAQVRWCEERGLVTPGDEHWAEDMRRVQVMIRDPHAAGLSTTVLALESARLVRAHWADVVAVARRLDRRGRL
jgi:hypothetical protein